MTRLDELYQAGRITRAQFQRAKRHAKVRARKLRNRARRNAKYIAAVKRANRNLTRFQERTGLEGTCAGFDGLGRFRYWDFERNEVAVWGRRRHRILVNE